MNMEVLLLQSGGGSGLINLVFFGAMILIFWLFLIRPQAKKQKQQNKFLDSLQKGDQVVTASGILGKINKMEEEIITLEVGTKTYIKVTKSAISKEMTDAVYGSDDKDKK